MKWVSGQAGSEDKTAAWCGIVQTLRKGVASRTSRTLTHFHIDRLLSETEDPSGVVLLFTCGHNFSKHRFETKVLPAFEGRVLSKTPVSGALILDRYRDGDYGSLACPDCVGSTIRALLV